VAAMCVGLRDQLEALVDGQVEPSVAAELRAHLAACDVCREHHAEAASLPSRLAAVAAPEPPPSLVRDVVRRVSRERVGALRLWAPFGAELALFLVTLWYVSGFRGLYLLVQRTAADAGAVLGWGVGQSDLPSPTAGDVFLLLLCALLIATTLYHLTLLSRQGARLV
jgi:anti-sigma factor RsiW